MRISRKEVHEIKSILALFNIDIEPLRDERLTERGHEPTEGSEN